MKPAALSLSITKGITFGPIVITCSDASGDPLDLTGWTAHAQARVKPGAALAFDVGPEITGATDGEITLAMTDTQTNLLTAGVYQWDLVLENTDGDRLGPYLAGPATVEAINTQP